MIRTQAISMEQLTGEQRPATGIRSVSRGVRCSVSLGETAILNCLPVFCEEGAVVVVSAVAGQVRDYFCKVGEGV